MKRDTNERPLAEIANGIYVRTGIRQCQSQLEWYCKLQASCKHEKRDLRGMCYECGQRDSRVSK